MPTRPVIKSTTGVYTSVGLINSILNDPANDLLSGIPKAQATTQSIRAVGEQITNYAPRRNQFVNSLINKIAMTRINSLMFSNPWSWAKQGKLELGETVEQIWLELAKAYTYNPEKSELHVLKQEKPKAMTAFHSVNYQVFYKITVNEEDLKAAFLSLDGLTDFIDRIIGQLVRSASKDEFEMMKYTLAVLLITGKIKVVQVPDITKDTASDVTTAIKTTTNLFQFPSSDFTMAGNENTTAPENIMVLESAKANAYLDVHSLANAFNVDYVKFMGNVVLFDDLSKYDWDRLDDLLADDPTYRHFTTDEVATLKTIDMIAMDRDFLQIYDRLNEMGEPFRNGEGLYTNYFYHVWEVFSASPFHNCVAYSSVPAVYSSITVIPSVASVVKGQSLQLVSNVEGSGFYRQDVVYTLSGNTSPFTIIEPSGVLHVAPDEEAAVIVVQAVTKYEDDEGKTVWTTATINVSSVERTFARFIVSPESITCVAGEAVEVTAFALYTDGTTEAVQAVAQGGSGNIESIEQDGYTFTITTTTEVGTGYVLFSTEDGEHVSDAYPVITTDVTSPTSGNKKSKN